MAEPAILWEQIAIGNSQLASAFRPTPNADCGCYIIRMRAVVQRVSRCRATVKGEVVGETGAGLLVLVGVSKIDNEAAADYLVEKIIGLRIFEDAAGKMNLSVQESICAMMVVSQFTLYGDVRRGKRPSFDRCGPSGRSKAALRILCRQDSRCRPAL
jgi:D-aminoacyl-tRNA deacylase